MVAFCAKPSVKFLKKGIQDFTTMVDSDMDQDSGEEAVLARGMRDGLQHIETQAWLHSDEHMDSEEEADVARGDIQDRRQERYIQDWRPANDVGYVAAPPGEPAGIELWPQRRPRVSDQEMLTRGIQEGVLPSRREGGEVQQSAFASMVDELASVSEDEASEEWSQIAMTPGSMAQSERDGQRGHPPLRMRRLREATPEGRSSVPTAVRRARAAGRVHLTSTDDVHRCGHCHEMTPPVHGYCLRCEGMVFCSEECLATHLYSVHREIDVKGRVQQAVEVILVMLLVACMLGAFESLGAEAADVTMMTLGHSSQYKTAWTLMTWVVLPLMSATAQWRWLPAFTSEPLQQKVIEPLLQSRWHEELSGQQTGPSQEQMMPWLILAGLYVLSMLVILALAQIARVKSSWHQSLQGLRDSCELVVRRRGVGEKTPPHTPSRTPATSTPDSSPGTDSSYFIGTPRRAGSCDFCDEPFVTSGNSPLRKQAVCAGCSKPGHAACLKACKACSFLEEEMFCSTCLVTHLYASHVSRHGELPSELEQVPPFPLSGEAVVAEQVSASHFAPALERPGVKASAKATSGLSAGKETQRNPEYCRDPGTQGEGQQMIDSNELKEMGRRLAELHAQHYQQVGRLAPSNEVLSAKKRSQSERPYTRVRQRAMSINEGQSGSDVVNLGSPEKSSEASVGVAKVEIGEREAMRVSFASMDLPQAAGQPQVFQPPQPHPERRRAATRCCDLPHGAGQKFQIRAGAFVPVPESVQKALAGQQAASAPDRGRTGFPGSSSQREQATPGAGTFSSEQGTMPGQGTGGQGHFAQAPQNCAAPGAGPYDPGDPVLCCQCGTEVHRGFGEELWTCARLNCGHSMCLDCREGALNLQWPMDLCVCHEDSLDGIDAEGQGQNAPGRPPGLGGNGGGGAGHAHVDPITQALLQNSNAMLAALTQKNANLSPQRHVKVPVLGSIPKGTAQDLEDIDGFLKEFERTCKQISGGPALPDDEQIAILLQCWEKGTVVGDALRLQQRQPGYLEAEKANKYQVCFEQLIAELVKKSTSRAQGRRIAQRDWRELKQTASETCKDFEQRFRKVYTAYCRFLPPLGEQDMLMHYLDSVSAEVSQYLSLHVSPTALDKAVEAAAAWQDIREAFPQGQSGAMQRQRATWPNDRKLAQGGLGENHAEGGARHCVKCGGVGHDGVRCPKQAASQDADFNKMTKDQREAVTCKDCGGKEHLARHHGVTVQNQNTGPGQVKLWKFCVNFN